MHKFTTEEIIRQKGDLCALKKLPRNEVVLILDNIRSVYNVGAIFRTADAARINKLYLCGITAHPPRSDIEKTALKTIDSVPWQYSENCLDIINELKKSAYQIVALEQTSESINYKNFKFKKPIAIVLGNEVNGIDEFVLNKCDSAVEIPMYGIANSLNVATAAGIILYHLI